VRLERKGLAADFWVTQLDSFEVYCLYVLDHFVHWVSDLTITYTSKESHEASPLSLSLWSCNLASSAIECRLSMS
jgi:hypothetical protein